MTCKEITIKSKYAVHLTFLGFESTKDVQITTESGTYKVSFMDSKGWSGESREDKIKRLKEEMIGTTGVDRRRLYQRVWRLEKEVKKEVKKEV